VYLLRHLHGSAALNAGVPIAVVAARLGHDPSVLLSVYAKVLEAEDRRWNEALGGAL
jgi:integrase